MCTADAETKTCGECIIHVDVNHCSRARVHDHVPKILKHTGMVVCTRHPAVAKLDAEPPIIATQTRAFYSGSGSSSEPIDVNMED
ncbi:hypothetical protein RUND412_001367 [Rhizina undulata]